MDKGKSMDARNSIDISNSMVAIGRRTSRNCWEANTGDIENITVLKINFQ